MTRDGDVIEIGCHSGLKTWTLTCDASKWIGVIGYCGSTNANKVPKQSNDITKEEHGMQAFDVSPSAYMCISSNSTGIIIPYGLQGYTFDYVDLVSFVTCPILVDVLVFGVSSLIILCSACIFLAGVIILKR